MRFILNVVGYLVNSLLIVLFLVVLAKFILTKRGKDLNTVFGGTIIRDLSELIFNETRKFIPIEEESSLSIALLVIFLFLFWVVSSLIIR